jgi:hypothetical protein
MQNTIQTESIYLSNNEIAPLRQQHFVTIGSIHFSMMMLSFVIQETRNVATIWTSSCRLKRLLNQRQYKLRSKQIMLRYAN